MKIISIYIAHNSTVGLFNNGICEIILHEEKFTNIKNYWGFPVRALEYLSKQIDINKVDFFVFSSTECMSSMVPNASVGIYEEYSLGKYRKAYNFCEYKTGFKKVFTSIRNYILRNMVSPKARKEIESWLLSKYSISNEKIKYIDHHLAHCLTPVYFFKKDYKNILLFSMDGAGDYSFAKIFIYNSTLNSLDNISQSSFDSSIGLLYSEMTKFLGMKPNEHEYKVMGLAAYVTDDKYYKHIYKKLAEIIWLNEDTLCFESKFNTNVASLFFRKHFFCERFDNLAAAVQALTENLVIKWIKASVKKTGIKAIAVSGGVFMNVKMNQKIIELPEVEKVYFQPSCGDESSVIGSACKIFLDSNVEIKPIQTMFLGHKYTNDEVIKFLKKNKIDQKYSVKYFDDIEAELAKLLFKFEVVARFKGSGEWGARSLCNRAVLGNASDLKTFYEVNDMIKMRDFWMPFAPSILEEWADKYIENWETIKKKAYSSSKYMILACNSTKLAQKHLMAAIHQRDKTLRPHIVAKEENKDLHKLLKYYEELTGMGGIMNTSLNLHGYPLVGTLEQALFTFNNSGLKYMSLENYMISKIG